MFQIVKATGTLSIFCDRLFYTQRFVGQPWIAAQLVQFLDEVIESSDRPTALLKLLGYTMIVSPDRPPRSPAHLWITVNLEERLLETNAAMIREAVDQVPAAADRPYTTAALRRIHSVLDRYDFTVKLFD